MKEKNLIGFELLFQLSQKYSDQKSSHVIGMFCVLPFLNISFNFTTFQVFGQTPCEIERLLRAEMYFF